MRLVLVGFLAVFIIGGGSAKADFIFGEPTNLGPNVNSEYTDFIGFESADGLEFYFCSGRPPGPDYPSDIWVMNRPTTKDDWSMPFNPGVPLNTSYHEEPQFISADGLELYIDSDRPGGQGREDIWVAKRKSKEDAWETPINMGPLINSSAHDFGTWISPDGLEFYYNSMRAGGYGRHDLYVTRRT